MIQQPYSNLESENNPKEAGSWNFFAMLSRMRYINRWGLMHNTMNENISEHSLDVAVIAHALAVIGNTYYNKNYNAERTALLAVFHDCTEIITGDMPTPVKYFAPELREAYRKVEETAKERLLKGMPEELRASYRPLLSEQNEDGEAWLLVKAADKLSAWIKCEEEERMGNDDFRQAKAATMEAIRNMKIEEADFFVKEFLPAYRLTLDEQTETRGCER